MGPDDAIGGAVLMIHEQRESSVVIIVRPHTVRNTTKTIAV